MPSEQQVAVVTGSADNIGAAVARKFASAGFAVVITARRDVERGERTAAEINKSGGKATFIQADVAMPEQAEALMEGALQKFGRLDVLINNAGKFEPSSFVKSTPDHWQRMYADNVSTAVNCCIAAAKRMPSPGGRIVNMASINALPGGGRPGGAAYSASKAAVLSLTKTLAIELAPNITVNAVAPGFTKTTAFDGLPDDLIRSFLDTTLLKRWLTCEEVADAFFYLANAPGVTGEVLVIDAGWNAQ